MDLAGNVALALANSSSARTAEEAAAAQAALYQARRRFYVEQRSR